MTRSRRAAAAGLALLLALCCAVGCGSDDQQDKVDEAGASGSDVPTIVPPTTAPPTSPASPTVAPADGPPLSSKHLTLHVPSGWKVDDGEFTFQSSAAPRGFSFDMITVSELPFLFDDVTLKTVKRHTLKTGDFGKTGRIEPNVEVSGVTMSHVSGRSLDYNEQFDAIVGHNQGVSIKFQLDSKDSAAERKQLVESVLASVQWKRP